MLKKICNLLIVVVIVFLGILVAILFLPRILGYQGLSVISGSMEPNIPIGSLVYAKSATYEEIKVDDVISYKLGTSIVTHRVYSKDDANQTITTKGDANEVVDGNELTISEVIGKVDFSIPYIGYLTIYVKTPLGIAFICGVLAILILLNYLPEIFTKESENKDEKNDICDCSVTK